MCQTWKYRVHSYQEAIIPVQRNQNKNIPTLELLPHRFTRKQTPAGAPASLCPKASPAGRSMIPRRHIARMASTHAALSANASPPRYGSALRPFILGVRLGPLSACAPPPAGQHAPPPSLSAAAQHSCKSTFICLMVRVCRNARLHEGWRGRGRREAALMRGRREAVRPGRWSPACITLLLRCRRGGVTRTRTESNRDSARITNAGDTRLTTR